MYPKNAASPQRIGIGAVVQISDGAVQTAGVSVSVMPQGGAASAGGGTIAYEQGIVHYLPTQAETNYASFIVIAYKTGCIPVSQTIVTTASGVAGYAGLDWATINAPTTAQNLSGTNIDTDQVVASVTGAVGSVTGNVGGNVTGSVASVVGAVGSVTGLTAANLDVAVSTRLATAGYTAPDNASIAAILIDTAEIGAAGAGLTALATAANLATVAGYIDTEIADIQGRLPAALVGGRMDSSVGAMAANTLTASALAADAVTEIQTGLSTLDAAGIRTAVGLASANIDTQLSAIDDYIDTEVAAIKAKTDNLPAAPAAVGDIPTAIENADALLNRDMSVGTDSGSPTVRTVRQALRFLRNKFSISGSTLTVTKEDDTTASWTAAVTTDAAALPITGSDPA